MKKVGNYIVDTSKVTRFEVIDHTGTIDDNPNFGRVFVKNNVGIETHIQDDGKTLKVFLNDRKKTKCPEKAS